MNIMEIVLLIAGGMMFLLSFIIPVSMREASGEAKELVQEEIKKLVSREMDDVKGHVDDVVNEAVEYAMEKTERSLERLSNEKIMAVNEYSDTVLREIHKNHEEVMFLYDMLNDKQTNLKNTVSQVNQAVKAAEETTREAEAMVNNLNSFKQLQPENIEEEHSVAPEPLLQDMSVEKAEDTAEEDDTKNNNEQILALYRRGKTIVAIAKELGLGVGEVKLVIDLYKNL